MDEIVVGIDVGTTKVCTLVGRVEESAIRILGSGVEPSEGIKKGVIVDLAAAAQAITKSVQKAEATSGVEITGAMVSLAGAHVSSINSRGVAGVSGEIIEEDDIARALDAARAVAIPHNREIIHIIQRGYTVDGQDGVTVPLGMHGYRLEVEAHIITAAAATVEFDDENGATVAAVAEIFPMGLIDLSPAGSGAAPLMKMRKGSFPSMGALAMLR